MNIAPRRLPALLCAATLLLTAGSLTACQTAENAAEETGDVIGEAADEASEFAGDRDIFAADIQDTEATTDVSGTAIFEYSDDTDEVRVRGRVEGLTPGLHGMHIHENGSCAMQNGTPAGAAGGHYNPAGSPHGAPDDPQDERHVGDFGNIRAGDDGVARFDFSYDRDATDMDELGDRALIVHGGRDDLRSQPSGDAGSRHGCAVLRSVDEDEAQSMLQQIGMPENGDDMDDDM